MKYSRYFEARYVCYNHPISTIYVSGILQKYYTYHLPNMCEYYCYSIHISDYIQSYRVPNRYLITSILTCDCYYKPLLSIEVLHYNDIDHLKVHLEYDLKIKTAKNKAKKREII